MKKIFLILFLNLLLFSCFQQSSHETTTSKVNLVNESNENLIANSKNLSIQKNYKNYVLESQNFKLIEIVKGLNNPWGMTFLDDNNMLITEKNGRLIRINLNTKEKFEVKHNINYVASGQGGLLDVLFNDNFIYFSYSEDRGSGYSSTSISKGRLVDDKIIELESVFQAEPPI